MWKRFLEPCGITTKRSHRSHSCVKLENVVAFGVICAQLLCSQPTPTHPPNYTSQKVLCHFLAPTCVHLRDSQYCDTAPFLFFFFFFLRLKIKFEKNGPKTSLGWHLWHLEGDKSHHNWHFVCLRRSHTHDFIDELPPPQPSPPLIVRRFRIIKELTPSQEVYLGARDGWRFSSADTSQEGTPFPWQT